MKIYRISIIIAYTITAIVVLATPALLIMGGAE